MIHVLYAEDDLVLPTMLEVSFAQAGNVAALEVVTTGQACLDRMAKGGVDVLLLDLELPDINGLRILGELAIRGDTTPVIMVSGMGQTDLAVKALRAGAVDCIDKASPQFRGIVEIVKRAHEAALTRPFIRMERTKKYCVWLIESSAAERGMISEFFRTSAPQVELWEIPSTDDLNWNLSGPGGADAAIVGTTLTGNSALDVLRKLRSQVADLPVILLTKINVAEQAVAAFKLGAQDYIQTSGDYLSQVVFSLSHGLSRAHLTRQNAELSRELAAINRSLEALVETRTQELHALSMRILRVQEDERREVARELHDQIGQLLTAIKLQIESTAQEAPPPLEAKLRDALNLAGELLSRTRNLTLQLRPQLLDDLGLQAAMEWHFQVFERQTGIAVAGEFSLPAGRLPSELETTIFRVVQEALTNVARHSGSGTADVTVVAEDAAILVEIADRGRGFDLAVEQAAHKSLGLAGMAERVKLAGGMLDIVSSPGKGTRVHASIPLPIPGAAP